ncbi:MAG: hypothetical protein FJ288_19780 [Planctomycetes bacterium]|nr:hypothetical protein [Planctomycetota bacterium]
MRRAIALVVALAAVLAAGAFWRRSESAASGGEAAEEARPAATDAANDSAFTDRLKEVRLIEIKHLRSNDEKDFQAGRQKLLAMHDEAAVKPIVQVLYGENMRYRGLLLEILGQFAARGSKVAQAYLQEIAVGDGNTANRRRAVANLKTWTGDPPTDRLMAHLAADKVPAIRDRAAAALAALNEKRAVWLLIEHLVTQEQRVTGAEIRDAQVTLDIRAQECGTPRFRTYPISAAVPGGIATFTIELPEVAVTDVATTVSIPDRSVTPVVQRIKVEHPEILAALKALTGKDFGYDQGAWQKWLQTAEAQKNIPGWQPVILKSEKK